MRCLRLILLAALTASGCTAPPVREEPDPVPATAAPSAPPCHDPDHLVRDLSVPWGLRTYVIAPCVGTGLLPMTTGPAASDSSAAEDPASP